MEWGRWKRASWVALVIAMAGCESEPGGGPVDDAGVGGGEDAAVDCSAFGADAPSTRGEIAGAYDATRGRIVIYGGNVVAPEMCMPRYQMTDEVWAFHVDCGLWEQLAPSGGGPGVRARAASVVDASGERIFFFGGRDRTASGTYENYADVWAYELATDTWTQVSSGDGPSARSSAVIAHDAARNRLLVFGGNTSTSGLTLTGTADLWALDLASGTWSELAAGGTAPSPRLYHSAVVVGSEMVVFGGTPDFDGPFMNDAYALDLTSDTWRLINDGFADGTPMPRFGHELYADAARGRVVVIGGHDPTDLGNRNDVWALDLASGAWSELRPGDTLNGMPSGPCEFPADFTIPEEGAPERRYAFARAQTDTRAFVVGGKTDCGNVNDVWALDFATGTWERLRAPTGGEACNRTGREGCTTLCY